jgi:hypothetical protein
MVDSTQTKTHRGVLFVYYQFAVGFCSEIRVTACHRTETKHDLNLMALP